MTAGFLLASMASLAFAITDFTASFVSRRLGSVNAVLGTMVVSGLALFIFALVFRQSLIVEPGWFVRVAILGAAFAVAYFNLFYALSLGPIVVVGPITGTFGILTVLMAVIFLGERPHLLQILCVPIAAIGSILASVVFTSASAWPRFVGRGPIFAALAVLFSAAVTVGLQGPVRSIGWLPSLFVMRLAGAATTIVVLLAISLRARGAVGHAAEGSLQDPQGAPFTRALRDIDLRVRWLIPALVLVGLGDTVGLSSVAMGLIVAPAWLVGLVTSTSPVLLTLLGLLILRERLHASQWLGVVLVTASLIAVNFG